jgi:hypothetical protein
MRGRILGRVSWGRLPLSGAASVCLGSFSKQGFSLDHLLHVVASSCVVLLEVSRPAGVRARYATSGLGPAWIKRWPALP